MTLSILRRLVVLGLFVPIGSLGLAEEKNTAYPDEPTITKTITELGSNSSVVLPKPRLQDTDGKELAGAVRHRDYCNKMVFAPERKTALYAGGSHQTWRGNDVWEYHLGSNTWIRLFAPDGDNHAHIKATLYGVLRPKLRDPKRTFDAEDKEKIAKLREWWKDNVVLKDGHLTTPKGGPIMPAHTWDALTYDPLTRRMLWSKGASPGSDPGYHAILMGRPLEEINKEIDATYTPMWTFDAASHKWIHQKTEGDIPRLAGMGATLEYIPDLKKSIYYVAAANVSPGDYEMWTYDAIANRWERLRPNDGKSIGKLAHQDKVAPLSEQQVAYSPEHRTLVAVHGPDVFAYDLDENVWSKIATDARINAHDAKTVFAYDSDSDVFLLANPKGKTKLAAFSLKTQKWEILEPKGPTIPVRLYSSYMGYYDPHHRAFVVAQGSGPVWLYRYKKSDAK